MNNVGSYRDKVELWEDNLTLPYNFDHGTMTQVLTLQ